MTCQHMFLMGELYLNLLEEIKRALQFSDFFFKSQTVIFKNDKSKIKSSNFAEADKKEQWNDILLLLTRSLFQMKKL